MWSHIVLTLLIGSGITSDVLMRKDIRTLILRAAVETRDVYRREPTPQIVCVGGNASTESARVDLIVCLNNDTEEERMARADTEDPRWSCMANLPPALRLGAYTVLCQGYQYEEDTHVSKRSCHCEYELFYTIDADTLAHQMPEVVHTQANPSVVYLFSALIGGVILAFLVGNVFGPKDNDDDDGE